MKAVLKNISSDRIDIERFKPEISDYFYLYLLLRIGGEESDGADNFDLTVCTPKWLLKNNHEPTWGRHMLIVNDYNLPLIKKYINEYIEKCSDSTWENVASKLSRVFAWEFEDYCA